MRLKSYHLDNIGPLFTFWDINGQRLPKIQPVYKILQFRTYEYEYIIYIKKIRLYLEPFEDRIRL
jgi:hypothetical protein